MHLHIVETLIAAIHQASVWQNAVCVQQVLVTLDFVLKHRPTIVLRALDADRFESGRALLAIVVVKVRNRIV